MILAVNWPPFLRAIAEPLKKLKSRIPNAYYKFIDNKQK